MHGLVSMVGEFNYYSMAKKVFYESVDFDEQTFYVGQKVTFMFENNLYYGIVYSWSHILYKYGLIHIIDVKNLVILEDNYEPVVFKELINMIQIHNYLELRHLNNVRGLLQQSDEFSKYLHLGKCKIEEHIVSDFTNHINEDVSFVILLLPLLNDIDDALKSTNGFERLILKTNKEISLNLYNLIGDKLRDIYAFNANYEEILFNLNYLDLGDKLKDFYVIKNKYNKYIVIDNKEFNFLKSFKINLCRYNYYHIVYLGENV